MGKTATTRATGRSRYYTGFTSAHLAIDRQVTFIYIGTVAMFTLLGILAYSAHSVFFIDALISIPVISVFYYYRKFLLFSWEGTLLVCLGGLMNMLGTLGAYEIYAYGIGWDKALHMTTMVGLTILIYSYLQRYHLRPVETAILAFLVAQGLGALNEIAEFIGTYFFGAGQGLFGMMNGMSKPTNGDFDTQWDLVTNTLGVAIGLAYASWKRRQGQLYKNPSAPPLHE